MMPARRRLPRACGLALLLVLIVLALGAGRAVADDKLRQSGVAWKAMDNCSRAATKAYPDYTAVAERRLCLRRNNLPGGDDPPAAPPTAAGDLSK